MPARKYDLVVVGYGPAGISAALWAGDLMLDAVVVDASARSGGQLLRVYNAVRNYPGVAASNGAELADRLLASVADARVEVRLGASAASIDPERRVVKVGDADVESRFVLVATGVRPRRLGVPGEIELEGRGIYGSATKEAPRFRGARVLVVGGGDAALEEALILASAGASVTIVHRRAAFRARPDFRARVASDRRIDVLLETRLVAVDGSDSVEAVRIEGPAGGRTLVVDAVFPCVGVDPNNGLLRGLVELDDEGYVRTDARQRTSVAWIYAAGDVCSHSSLTVAAAVGHAAAAVKDISRRLSANA